MTVLATRDALQLLTACWSLQGQLEQDPLALHKEFLPISGVRPQLMDNAGDQ